jgi:hypothetical protein
MNRIPSRRSGPANEPTARLLHGTRFAARDPTDRHDPGSHCAADRLAGVRSRPHRGGGSRSDGAILPVTSDWKHDVTDRRVTKRTALVVSPRAAFTFTMAPRGTLFVPTSRCCCWCPRRQRRADSRRRCRQLARGPTHLARSSRTQVSSASMLMQTTLRQNSCSLLPAGAMSEYLRRLRPETRCPNSNVPRTSGTEPYNRCPSTRSRTRSFLAATECPVLGIGPQIARGEAAPIGAAIDALADRVTR